MNFLRSTLTVGGITMLSRVLGFVRDILIARSLGAGIYADAFWVAFRFPNLFRRFFAEGAFNAAFVPLYAKRLEGEGEASATAFASEALSGLAALLLVLTLVFMALMPWFVLLTAGGFLLPPGGEHQLSVIEALRLFFSGHVPEKFTLTIALTRICFPYLLLISLVALLSGILNSMRRFVAAAAAPILLNLSLVIFPMLTWRLFPNPGYALAWSVTLGGVLQLGLLIWGVRRQRLLPRLVIPRWTPDMKRLVILGIPGIVAGGITQINIVIGTMIATFQPGAASMLSYADRLYQLPQALIVTAMGVVLLPEISRRLRAGDHGGAQWTQNRALEMSMLLMVPAAVALIVIPGEIIRTLYMHGAFTAADAAGTAAALRWYGMGLPAFALIKIFQVQYFAREDTRTPMWFAGVSTAVNIAGSLIFFNSVGFIAIAASTSAAAWVNALLLIFRLRQIGGIEFDARVVNRLPRILLASGLMGAVLLGCVRLWPHVFAAAFIVKLAALLGLVLVGGASYGLFVLLTGAASFKDVTGALRRQKQN
jgi:putative peptidoglycan lipid II flippase